MAGGTVSAEQLRLFIERIERLEEEKAGIATDIRDVYLEAKGQGFDARTIREIIKLRKLDADQRREREALLDIYKAALGMLDGTPLGNWAASRLKKPEEPDAGEARAAPDDGAAEEHQPPAPPEPFANVTIDDARAMGAKAAAEGRPVTANPLPARDPRRAAWDEAWCSALGSDGMDIPEVWRPSPKRPADDAKAGK